MAIRLVNKDCLEFLREIETETIDMVFADPPFNVGMRYKGYKDDVTDYRDWCERWITECFRVLKSTGTFYLMTIDKHLEWKMPLMAAHGVFINLVKWKNVSAVHDKRRFWISTQPVLMYGKTDSYIFNTYAQTRPQHEVMGVWSKDRANKIKGQLLDYWDDIPFVYAGCIKHKEAIIENGTNKKAHCCQMPEMLAGRAILFSTNEGDTVLDPFSGSGTTAAACYKLKRDFIGCEVSSEYFNLSLRRLQQLKQNLFDEGIF